MANFARINADGIVLEVRKINTKDTVDREGVEHESIGAKFLERTTGLTGWIKTSFNTRNDKHFFEGNAFRKNYAVVGGKYLKDKDAFIPPKPEQFPSWVLSEEIWDWVPPLPKPVVENPNELGWDEKNQKWIIKVRDGFHAATGEPRFVVPK